MTLPKRCRVSACDWRQSSSRCAPAAGEINLAKSCTDHFPARTQRCASRIRNRQGTFLQSIQRQPVKFMNKTHGQRLSDRRGNNKSPSVERNKLSRVERSSRPPLLVSRQKLFAAEAEALRTDWRDASQGDRVGRSTHYKLMPMPRADCRGGLQIARWRCAVFPICFLRIFYSREPSHRGRIRTITFALPAAKNRGHMIC